MSPAAEGYGELAEIYERSRPPYPSSILAALVQRTLAVEGEAVAEIGAGTGRFTGLLAQRGYKVSALEPVEAMRARAAPHPGVEWSAGSFEQTGLPDASQCWVISAQAFHQADARRALPEIRRVLVPRGWFTVLWNVHHLEREPTLRWTYDALARHVPQYGYVDRSTRMRRRLSEAFARMPERWQRSLAALGALGVDVGRLSKGVLLQSSGDFGKVFYDEVLHRVKVDVQGYLDLWRSRSQLRALAGPLRFAALLDEMEQHLHAHKIERVAVPYVCSAWSTQARQ